MIALLLVWGAVAPAVGQTLDPTTQRQITSWFSRAKTDAPGEWGISIADADGNILWGVNSDAPLIPASTVKLLTTGFARSIVGADGRRPTRVVGRGTLDPITGDWEGDWALELNGDPTFEHGGGPSLYDLAVQLRDQGIRTLHGPLEVWSADGPAEAHYPDTWSPRHRGRLFAPLIGALTINENVVGFTLKPGRRIGDRARLVAERPGGVGSMVSVEARTSSGRQSRLRIRPVPGGGWVISGSIGQRSRARYLSVPATDPKAVLTAAWADALDRAGIHWAGRRPSAPVPDGAPRVLAEVVSPPFDSVASEVNRRSNNLGAELMLRWAAGQDDGPALLTQHVRQVSGSAEGVQLVDGSGLSYDDRVAPSVFTAYLARFPSTPGGRNFPQLLPANGTGTLKSLNRGLPARGVLRAKTGTLNRVSTVVGYLGRPDGVLLVSLMYNGPRPSTARHHQWRLFRQLGADGVLVPDEMGEPEPVQLGGEADTADFSVDALARALQRPTPSPDDFVRR